MLSGGVNDAALAQVAARQNQSPRNPNEKSMVGRKPGGESSKVQVGGDERLRERWLTAECVPWMIASTRARVDLRSTLCYSELV